MTAKSVQAQIDAKRTAILMDALGHVLTLADPDDPNCLVGSIHDNGEDNRRIREAVRLYLMSWIAEPMAVALGAGPMGSYPTHTRETVKAEAFLEEMKVALAR